MHSLKFPSFTKLIAVVLAFLGTSQSQSEASLLFTLTDGGGSLVNYNFSGSATYTGTGVPAFDSSFVNLPDTSEGTWRQPFDSTKWAAHDHQWSNVAHDSSSTIGAVIVRVNGTPVPHTVGNPIRLIVFDQFTSPTSDGVYFLDGASGNFQFPSVSNGDIISWSGTGTFGLGSGTFATNFIAGTYAGDFGDGIEYTLQIGAIESAVPEPNSLTLFGLVLLMGSLAYRFRSINGFIRSESLSSSN